MAVDWAETARQTLESRPAQIALREGGWAALREEVVSEVGDGTFIVDPREPLAQRHRDLICVCGDVIGVEPFIYAPRSGSPTHARCIG